MKQRSALIAWIRGETVGPTIPVKSTKSVQFRGRELVEDGVPHRGPLSWKPTKDDVDQEILHFDRESPHRKYGAGSLHPFERGFVQPEGQAAEASDTLGADTNEELAEENADNDLFSDQKDNDISQIIDDTDDFEVTSPDVRRPSVMGLSFAAKIGANGIIRVELPKSRMFFWQDENDAPTLLNGRYEACKRLWQDEKGIEKTQPLWRRVPATSEDSFITVKASELVPDKVVRKDIPLPAGSPLRLSIDVYPRRYLGSNDDWLITIALRNNTDSSNSDRPKEIILYQTYYEITLTEGNFIQYPESKIPFKKLDEEEQSLSLLYRDSCTWAVGHGCSAGWWTLPNNKPDKIFCDVMPAVELPSMTPDIEVDGKPVELSMRELYALSNDGNGAGWDSLNSLVKGYEAWIQKTEEDAKKLPEQYSYIVKLHMDGCRSCLRRMKSGLSLIRNNHAVRTAFKLTNLSMLLQQISTKQINRRRLAWSAKERFVVPEGDYVNPWQIFINNSEDRKRVGNWRAFQMAFFLLSLEGIDNPSHEDREFVDLIWFPTGGGKTEAYLAVMAFCMFHQRFIKSADTSCRRDGTNVLMRYTLRMLTTQQFQRAASLICSMEYLRRHLHVDDNTKITGDRFSLGLWIGADGAPNKITKARSELSAYRKGNDRGNPLVITECPWCRAEIGRCDDPAPDGIKVPEWKKIRVRGIVDDGDNGPLLLCSDIECEFGGNLSSSWLPIEVIDERIYLYPPSLIIGTADKFAMVSFKPEAGAIFGKQYINGIGKVVQVHFPPSLIIQDELHLISGPLGTMYALYEGIFEELTSIKINDIKIKPKIISSTATIRGAANQVLSLYGREKLQLFPSPGISMGDSFFGKYATDNAGKFKSGRLYLGIHATDYGSVLTTQVRAFSSALMLPWTFEDNEKDPWWTLLTFYNSIRELGGARTLFDSDIRSRLKFLFNREGYPHDDRRNLRIVEELTSRLSQSEIVKMMDQLATTFTSGRSTNIVDACLASNIIEVGVDIDRLSLMAVVGQPKTTSTYIQVTGRVGRRWWERPGLILSIYNPGKSRDRSHYEQFHSYHRRLYERVEPTTATPFAVSAIKRGLAGALICWARQHARNPVSNFFEYEPILDVGFNILKERCKRVQSVEDRDRSLAALDAEYYELKTKWKLNPQTWSSFPQHINGEYLMLLPGQFATGIQKKRGVEVPTSMRQVDKSGELEITQGYAANIL